MIRRLFARIRERRAHRLLNAQRAIRVMTALPYADQPGLTITQIVLRTNVERAWVAFCLGECTGAGWVRNAGPFLDEPDPDGNAEWRFYLTDAGVREVQRRLGT